MSVMTIYIGDLSIDITDEELRQEFAAFGEVRSVVIINKKYTGSCRHIRYAFVEMPSQSEGQEAITALDGKMLEHGTIRVIKALPLSENKSSVSRDDKKRGIPGDSERKRRY